MKKCVLVSSADLRPSLMDLLRALHEEELLGRVMTTLAIDTSRGWGRWFWCLARRLPEPLARGMEKRVLPGFLKTRVETWGARELIRLTASRIVGGSTAHGIWWWAECGFDRWVARSLREEDVCVYGMENSSLETFRRQKQRGGRCVLRAVMAHGRKVQEVIQDEIRLHPEEPCEYEKRLLADQPVVMARKEEECRLADRIVANSDFVKQTFVEAGVAADKVEVIPTGCPPVAEIPANAGKGSAPLVFLYAGTLSLRKGVLDLLAAWKAWQPKGHAELWLAGAREVAVEAGEGGPGGVRYLGAVSRSRLDEIYRQADVLVLPTHLEGLAHVILEAIACGLPVITTRESGCGHFVEDGVNGRMVRPGDVSGLTAAMEWCLENRGQLSAMGKASTEKARQWSVADSCVAHGRVVRRVLGAGG